MPISFSRIWRYIAHLGVKYRLSQKLPFILGFLAITFGSITYSMISSQAPSQKRLARLMPWLILDFLVLLGLLVSVGRKVVELWQERRQKRRGAKLHAHMAGLFGLFALIPTILMIPFMITLLNMGLEWWFASPIERALEEANEVTRSYVHEAQKAIFIDAHVIAKNIKPQIMLWVSNKDALSEVLTHAAEERGISEALILNEGGSVLARSLLGFSLEFEPIPSSDFDRAKSGEVVVHHGVDRVRAFIQIDPATSTYLFLGKVMSRKMMEHVNYVSKAVTDYKLQRGQHEYVQLTMLGFFFLVSVLLILLSVWLGLIVANTLVSPIRSLVTAADELSKGDWNVRVEAPRMNNDLDDLVGAFNHMIERMQQQQQDLVMSQRQLAWSDVARKIAHEIKNPLTPIQLSAERLRRRYLDKIDDKPEIFENCVQTIIKQVKHIEHLVSEFSSFARMPEASMVEVDLVSICKEVIFLQTTANSAIHFEYQGEEKYIYMCDPQYMHQALNNIVQNAAQALAENNIENPRIVLSLYAKDSGFIISCSDNGPGFPVENRDRIAEPYYTTRKKGTGLGLAIVSKVINDHKGRLVIRDAPEKGAIVEMIF